MSDPLIWWAIKVFHVNVMQFSGIRGGLRVKILLFAVAEIRSLDEWGIHGFPQLIDCLGPTTNNKYNNQHALNQAATPHFKVIYTRRAYPWLVITN
jgi:hypothetical protein